MSHLSVKLRYIATAALIFAALSSAALAQGLPINFTGNGPGGSVWADGRVIGYSSDPAESARILFRHTQEQATD